MSERLVLATPATQTTSADRAAPQAPAPPGRRTGRRPSTSRADIEHVALRLFDAEGFEQTTVDDVATAAGIGRRTFFRYFPSKNDVLWGDFEAGLARMRAGLDGATASVPLMPALRAAVLDFNHVEAEEAQWHRRRMRLLLTVPALQAHSSLKYRAWRAVVADFAAARTGTVPTALGPRTLSYAALGAAMAAYECWLDEEDADLEALLSEAFEGLGDGFEALVPRGRAR